MTGFLLIDKPEGIGFNTVVKTVKRKFGLVKVGHGGSLDTQASGLLVVILGDANKFANDVMGADREYEIEVEVEGEVEVEKFRGDIFQTEPRYAVIKREDTGVYETVDTGEHQPFMTHIYRIDPVCSNQELLQAPSPEYRAAPPSGLRDSRSLALHV